MADYEEDFEDFEELDHHESSGYLSMKENVNTINVTRELKPEKKKKSQFIHKTACLIP